MQNACKQKTNALHLTKQKTNKHHSKMKNTTAQNTATAAGEISVLHLRAQNLKAGDKVLTLRGDVKTEAAQILADEPVYDYEKKYVVAYAIDGTVYEWKQSTKVFVERMVPYHTETAKQNGAEVLWLYEVENGIARYEGRQRGSYFEVRLSVLRDFGTQSKLKMTVIG